MNDFPKLRKNLEALIIEFNETLQEKFEAGEIEAVELNVSEFNFVERSPRTQGILALVKLLKELDDPAKLELKHVFAAQSLLRISQHRELATEILIQAIPHESKKISEAATKALGELTNLGETSEGSSGDLDTQFTSEIYSENGIEVFRRNGTQLGSRLGTAQKMDNIQDLSREASRAFESRRPVYLIT